MTPSSSWRGRRLVWVLVALGVALPAFDVWRWWSASHPADRGDYRVRADWSAPSQSGVHLSGFAFRDRNRDGRFDLGDEPMAGVAFALSGPGGAAAIARTNVSGFANFVMSASARGAPVGRPGAYSFRALTPPGWGVTSGNAEQATRIASLPGAPGDLAPDRAPLPVGFAPALAISGRLLESRAGALAEAGPPATLVATAPSGERRAVALDAHGGFAVPAVPGAWSLVARAATGAELRREVVVRDAPVAVLGLVLGDAGATAAVGGRRRIDFETVTAAGVGKIPAGYGGLDWQFLNALAAESGELDGYQNALVSGRFVAYSSSGLPVTVSRAGRFDFLGVYAAVASPRAEGERLHVQAFRGERLVADDDVTLSALGPVWVDAGLCAVDRVVLASRHAWQFALDDLEVASPAVGASP